MHRGRILLAAALLAAALLLYPAAEPTVRGRVVGPAGPLAGARVRHPGHSAFTHTDAAGHFQLPARAGGRVAAWKEGFFIGGGVLARGALEVRLTPLPTEDHEGYVWVDPTPSADDAGRCGNCHDTLWREWSGGGHARSAMGRHFRGLYEGSDGHGRPAGVGLLSERPDGAGVCAACHAPGLRDDDPALFDLRQVRGVAARGVHCDYCHKVAGLGEGEIGLTHGRFLLRLLRPAQGQLFFGPLDDVAGEDSFSPFQRDSRFCAACHEGTLFGVPVYRTYSEWLDSPPGRRGVSCQQCHLKPTGTMGNFAPGHGGLDRDPLTLANHRFWDSSLLAMLRRCVQLQVRLTRLADHVAVEVSLTARDVGHRVPTGFIDRHLILVVEGRDARGQRCVVSAGPTLDAASGAALAGQAGRVYGRRLRQGDDPLPAPFWRRGVEETDTRLSPEVPDVAEYRFPATVTAVRLRLIHRRFWATTATDKGWPMDDLIIHDRLMNVE